MNAQGQRANLWDWLHDDAEEDSVAADWYQRAIGALYASLADVSTTHGWPWHVGNQLRPVSWKPDGTRWRPSPDIMVHPHAGPEVREEMSVNIAFRPDGDILRVFGPEGQPVRYREESLRDTMPQARQTAQLRAELARLRGEEI